MAINLTQFNFQEDLTSQTFNQKLTEIQTHLNNLSSANERLIRENQELRQLLNNKVNKVTVYSLNELSVTDLQNGGFEHNYETTTTKSNELGLGAGIWHIKYFKYVPSEGYGFQIALPVTGDRPKWRKAGGKVFQSWNLLS